MWMFSSLRLYGKIVDIVGVMFSDLYQHTGEVLGNGAYASVQTYRNIDNNKEYAVKVSWSRWTTYRNDPKFSDR